MRSVEEVRESQVEWARRHGVAVDADGYVGSLEENLVVPMSAETRREFGGGSGSELGGEDGRGKMQALHSSSALAYNLFEYWRHRQDRGPLQRALGLDEPVRSISFEVQFPTGLRGTPPNLDVVLECDDHLIGIESKFLEPFTSTRPFASFSDSYFPEGRKLWGELGLYRCGAVAAGIRCGELEFRFLDAPQLLKHALGLWRHDRAAVSLWCLYFELSGDLGAELDRELSAFRGLVGDELNFEAHSYQDVVERLAADAESDSYDQYVRYLRGRYGRTDAQGDRGAHVT